MRIFLKLIVFMLLTISTTNAAQFLNYGFENWGGTIETSPGYIYTTTAQSYYDDHRATSTVTTTYTDSTGRTVNPHSGSYFFLLNAGPNMDPLPTGITGWATESRTNIGIEGPFGGDSTFNVQDITSGEYFLRFYFVMSDWDAVITNHDAKLKFIRFQQQEETDQIWYMYQNVADNRRPQIGYDGEGAPVYYSPTIEDFDDGNWHRVSMYVNYTTGVIAIWYDIENETLQNATFTYDYGPGGVDGTYPYPIVTINNWSGNNPTENVWFGIDDVEVWDEIPPAGPSTPPTVTLPAAATVTSTIYDITGSYTIEAGRTVDTCVWSNNRGGAGSLTATGGVVSGTITGLSSGDNIVTVTLTDSSAESGVDTMTITRNLIIKGVLTKGMIIK